MRGPEPLGKARWRVAGPGARWPAAAAAMALLVWGGGTSLRQAWAEHLVASGRREEMRRALELVPGRAEFYLAMADIAERAGEDPVPWLRQAALVSPADASIRIHLGLRQELAGRVAEAEGELIEAARLSRKYLPRWTLANFYYRQGRSEAFWRWAQEALAVSYGDRRPLFELCWRLRPEADFLLERVLPPRPAVLSDFSWFLLDQGELEAAGRLLAELVDTAPAADRERLLDAAERLLEAGAEQAAARLWNGLARRGLLPYPPLAVAGGPLVTNGDFSVWTTGRGFDWKIPRVEGVFVAPGPRPGWRISLNGRQPERCELLRQTLVVESGRLYRIECRYRAEFKGFAGGEPTGLRWRLRLPDGRLLGESSPLAAGGGREILEFKTDRSGATVLALVYERAPGRVRPEGFVELEAVQAASAIP